MTHWLSFVLLALAAADEPAPFGFAGIELYKASVTADNLVAGDFDGDGLRDFALVNDERSRIEIFLQKTAEERTRSKKNPAHYDDVNEIHDDARFEKRLIPLESTVHAMIAADLDVDGTAELVTRAVPPRLTVWRREKADRWEKSQSIKLKEGAGHRRSLLAEDLNGDGRLDVAMLGKEKIYLFLQNEQGRLAAPETFPTALREGNGLAFLRPESGRPALVIYRIGQEHGIAIRPLLGQALGPEWIHRTGRMDTIYLPPRQECLSIVSVMRVSGRLHEKTVKSAPNADHVFETPLSLYPVTAERGTQNRGIAVGDLNGDGRADVVVSRPAASVLSVYLQREDGFFDAPRDTASFAGSRVVQVGDFDGDGTAEVLAVSENEHIVGLAAFRGDRLANTRPVAGIQGTPLAAIAASLTSADRMDLAVAAEMKRKYAVFILPAFAGPPVRVDLKDLRSKPTRLLAIDLDHDGDQDLAVVGTRGAFGLVLNEGGGKFTALAPEAFGGKWLLKNVPAQAYAVTRLPDGKEAILVAKKTIGRAMVLNAQRQLVVADQISAGDAVTLAGIARSGDEIVVFDEKSASLIVLTRRDGEWKRRQEIELPSSVVRSVRAVRLRAEGPPDLLVAEKSGFLIVRRGQTEGRLESTWNYESDVKDARLRLVAQGDLNADGKPDLAVTDSKKRALELLVPPEKAGAKVHRGLRFEIYEDHRGLRRRSSQVREMVVADVTGDRKDDLLFLLHDRVVLYPQE